MDTTRPAPECLTPNSPDRWTQQPTPATRESVRVNPGARTLAAPTTHDPAATALRRFATLRAAMEPKDPDAHAREIATIYRQHTTPETGQALARALDLWRIAHHARTHSLANLDAITDPALAHRAAAAAMAGADAEAVVAYIEAQTTSESRSVAHAITKHRPDLREPLKQFRAAATRILANSQKTNRYGTSERHLRTTPTDDPATRERIPDAVSPHAWSTDVSLAHALNALLRKLDDNRQPAPPEEETEQPHDPTSIHEDPAHLWMPLRVWRGLMTAPHLGMLARTSRSRVNTGRTVADPRRLYTDPDRRAFYRRARQNGGTVVVDISGSMSLTFDDVRAVLTAATGATIYAYNHLNDDYPTLHLLAENGRAVSALPRTLRVGGSNGVDAPALRYAAERHDPRQPFVWVSDAQYNGRGRGTGDPFLATDLGEVLTAARAVTVPTIDAAVVMLDRMSRGGHPDPHELPESVSSRVRPSLRDQYRATFPTTQVGRFAR